MGWMGDGTFSATLGRHGLVVFPAEWGRQSKTEKALLGAAAQWQSTNQPPKADMQEEQSGPAEKGDRRMFNLVYDICR